MLCFPSVAGLIRQGRHMRSTSCPCVKSCCVALPSLCQVLVKLINYVRASLLDFCCRAQRAHLRQWSNLTASLFMGLKNKPNGLQRRSKLLKGDFLVGMWISGECHSSTSSVTCECYVWLRGLPTGGWGQRLVRSYSTALAAGEIKRVDACFSGGSSVFSQGFRLNAALRILDFKCMRVRIYKNKKMNQMQSEGQ